MNEENLLEIGTRIRFTKRLDSAPAENNPAYLYAKLGQKGTIKGYSNDLSWPYSVVVDGYPNPFKVSSDEFEVVEQ